MKIQTASEELNLSFGKKATLEVLGESWWASVKLTRAQAAKLAKALQAWADPIKCSRHAHLLSKGIER